MNLKQQSSKTIGSLIVVFLCMFLINLIEIPKTLVLVNKRYKTIERAKELYYYREHLAEKRYQLATDYLKIKHDIRRKLTGQIKGESLDSYHKRLEELDWEIERVDYVLKKADFDTLSESSVYSSYSSYNSSNHSYEEIDDHAWEIIHSYVKEYSPQTGGEQ